MAHDDAPSAVTGILAMIDERQSALSDLQSSIRRCHELFGPSFWSTVAEYELAAAAPPLALPAPAPVIVESPRPERKVTRPSGPRGGRPEIDRAALSRQVLVALKAGPSHGLGLAASTGGHVSHVREVLAELVVDGRVQRTGAGKHVRFSLPGMAPKPKAAPVAAARETPRDRVLAWLATQKEPARFQTLVEVLRLDRKTVRTALAALEADGDVVRRGSKGGLRLGIPAVMAAAAPRETPRPAGPTEPAARETKAAPRATPAPTRETNALVDAIADVLKSGVSYDAKEMRRRVRPVVGDVTLDVVAAALESMVGARVERLWLTETSPKRYRGRFGGKRRGGDEVAAE